MDYVGKSLNLLNFLTYGVDDDSVRLIQSASDMLPEVE